MGDRTKPADGETSPVDPDLLIDYRLGQVTGRQASEVEQALAADEAFAAQDRDLTHALSALGKMPPGKPPETLVGDTMARLAAARRTDALLAREEAARPYRRSTFTTREMVAAAAAVILLAAVFVPSMYQAQVRTAQIQCRANVGAIGSGLIEFANQNDQALPIASADAHAWMPTGQKPATSNSEALFKLIQHASAPQQIFQCPAMGTEPFAVEAGMHDFPGRQYINYSYQHAVGPNSLARYGRLEDIPEDMAILADENPLFPKGHFSADRIGAMASHNHGQRGQNVLYPTGAAEWRKDALAGHERDNIFLAGSCKQYSGMETPVSPHDTFLLPAYTPGN